MPVIRTESFKDREGVMKDSVVMHCGPCRSDGFSGVALTEN